MTDKIKTPGIAILGVLAILCGLIVGFQFWAKYNVVSEHPETSNPFLDYQFYLSCFPPFAAGIGVLMRKNWGRIIYIVYMVFLLCFSVFFTVKDVLGGVMKAMDALPGFFIFLLYIIPIWYFLRPKVKEQFK